MSKIEDDLRIILSKPNDFYHELIKLCKTVNPNEKYKISFTLQEELRAFLAGREYEEEAWENLLMIIAPSEISENLFYYLLQEKISILRLCHLPLSDKWLEELIPFDDAPLYELARRYYLSAKYSLDDFSLFYHQFLYDRDDIALFLLDIYGNSDKHSLLICLCSDNTQFADREELEWYKIADKVRNLTDSQEINQIYMTYRNVGIILAEIAANHFTSEDILLNLLTVKDVSKAKRIRENSARTLAIKKRIRTKT